MTVRIEITEELYERLGAHAKPFETPAQVIERLLTAAEEKASDTSLSQSLPHTTKSPGTNYPPPLAGKLQINFFPSDPIQFKAQLLKHKEAWVRLYYQSGQTMTKHWVARSFKPTSDVMANLRSGYLRGWREKGIVRADVAIDVRDLPTEGQKA